jgi:hypothetical protein
MFHLRPSSKRRRNNAFKNTKKEECGEECVTEEERRLSGPQFRKINKILNLILI